MGYGVPAAVAMKLLRPERLVLSLAGDGDFLMNGQEFATAVQYNLPIVFIVCDNASYGTIRMHQEREFPGRVVGTELRNPDFAAYARAFGGFGVTVERTEDFPQAFKAAHEAGVPSIIHLKIDVDAITPATSWRVSAPKRKRSPKYCARKPNKAARAFLIELTGLQRRSSIRVIGTTLEKFPLEKISSACSKSA